MHFHISFHCPISMPNIWKSFCLLNPINQNLAFKTFQNMTVFVIATQSPLIIFLFITFVNNSQYKPALSQIYYWFPKKFKSLISSHTQCHCFCAMCYFKHISEWDWKYPVEKGLLDLCYTFNNFKCRTELHLHIVTWCF